MNINSLNIINYKLIGEGDNNYIRPYKIRNCECFNYRKLSRNR